MSAGFSNLMWFGWAANELILASKSKGRAQLLRGAGIPFSVVVANIDERKIENEFSGAPDEIAQKLATEKARAVSRDCPGRLVLAGDQVLALERELLHKAETKENAFAQLRRLSGREHRLHSAAALVKNDAVLFQHVSTVIVRMIPSSDEMLEAYMEAVGDRVFDTVGGYEIEGVGVNLIQSIEGDYFTVVGFPLLPFLAYCRSSGLIGGHGVSP